MANSMTGFGRSRRLIDGRDILLEIKSVNHRYFEFSARTPRAYGYLDDKLKTMANGVISRGKVEVGVTIYTVDAQSTEIEMNKALVRSYVEVLRSVADEFSLKDDLSLSAVSRFPEVFAVRKSEEDQVAIWAGVKEVAAEAMELFLLMRSQEGERLVEDVLARLSAIENAVGRVEELSPKTVVAYRERLRAKLNEVLEGKGFDDSRILTEAAIFADKVAVDEETVRLHSHIQQFRTLLASGDAVGRRLDFLTQELNREVNTIGSKCQDVEVTNLVLGMKAEVEKIREQIQNIE